MLEEVNKNSKNIINFETSKFRQNNNRAVKFSISLLIFLFLLLSLALSFLSESKYYKITTPKIVERFLLIEKK